MSMQNLRGFLEGGLASIVAGCSTHPFDVIKVRMQLEASDSSSSSLSFNVSDLSSSSSSCASSPAMCVGTDPFSVGLRLVQAEGLHSLFTGISATILRQSLYSTTRISSINGAILRGKAECPCSRRLPPDSLQVASVPSLETLQTSPWLECRYKIYIHSCYFRVLTLYDLPRSIHIISVEATLRLVTDIIMMFC